MSFSHIKVTDDLYWVGVFDPKLRIFDIVMETPYGSTYNSFLLRGADGIVIFETAKEGFSDEFIARIKSVMKPGEDVKYIVMNHTEPDHSGSLTALLTEFPNATVVATAVAQGNLLAIAHESAQKMKKITATAGLELSIGNYTLKFIPAPLIHWPDTMMTYIPELKTLIPCDFFGSHFCHEKMFNDLICSDPKEEANMWDSFEYYYHAIFGPFKSFAKAALDKVKDLEINMICCSHGPIIRSNIPKYFEKYYEWSTEPKREDVVLIGYTAAYKYTAHMAESIKKGVESTGFKVKMFDMLETKTEEIVSQCNTAKGLLLGSPTLIGDVAPPVWAVTSNLNPFIHKGLVCGCFGSFGWSGEATKNLQQRFAQLRFKTPVEPKTVKFKPTEVALKECEEWGASFVKAL